MKDHDKPNKRAWERLVKIRITENQQVWSKPCFLYFASITAGLAGPATAIIRNGDNVAAEPIFDLSAPPSAMGSGTFSPPIYFSKEVFVEIGANVTSVFLHIRQEN